MEALKICKRLNRKSKIETDSRKGKKNLRISDLLHVKLS